MMSNMNPNEIKKALECCCSKTEMFCTKDCPLYEYNGNCWYAMKFDALAYINLLEAEVEKYKEFPIHTLSSLALICTRTSEEYDELIAGIGNEAIKEFAERLKSELSYYVANISDIREVINNTAREIVRDARNF